MTTDTQPTGTGGVCNVIGGLSPESITEWVSVSQGRGQLLDAQIDRVGCDRRSYRLV
jgi:hypothetical protein